MVRLKRANTDNVDKALFNCAELSRYIVVLSDTYKYDKNTIIDELIATLYSFLDEHLIEKTVDRPKII